LAFFSLVARAWIAQQSAPALPVPAAQRKVAGK
jgi:hypothetical protein